MIFSICAIHPFHALTSGPRVADYRPCETMLRIERSNVGRIVLSLSGRIESTDVAELRRLLSLEAPDEVVVLDLRDVTLVHRDGVRFLARCENETVRLEHCPAYVREWIDAERKSQDTDQVRPD